MKFRRPTLLAKRLPSLLLAASPYILPGMVYPQTAEEWILRKRSAGGAAPALRDDAALTPASPLASGGTWPFTVWLSGDSGYFSARRASGGTTLRLGEFYHALWASARNQADLSLYDETGNKTGGTYNDAWAGYATAYDWRLSNWKITPGGGAQTRRTDYAGLVALDWRAQGALAIQAPLAPLIGVSTGDDDGLTLALQADYALADKTGRVAVGYSAFVYGALRLRAYGGWGRNATYTAGDPGYAIEARVRNLGWLRAGRERRGGLWQDGYAIALEKRQGPGRLLQIEYGYYPLGGLTAAAHSVTLQMRVLWGATERSQPLADAEDTPGSVWDSDILSQYERLIQAYRAENGGKPPSSLDDLWDDFARAGYDTLPKPLRGRLLYDARSGGVWLAPGEAGPEFDWELLMIDDSRLIGDIVRENQAEIYFQNRLGLLRISRGQIREIRNLRLINANQHLLDAMRTFIYRFRQERARYPGDLDELAAFMRPLGITAIPQPNNRQWHYDAHSGRLSMR